MKIFMFLHQHPFLHVNTPAKLNVDEYGSTITKIRAQSGDLTQVNLLPPPFSLPDQLPEMDNHLICYGELKKAISNSFNFKQLTSNVTGHPNMMIPYTHFAFDIFESPSLTSQGQHDDASDGQGQLLDMVYQLKMRITDDLGNDWFKILRRVCGGGKVKISASLEVGRKGVNGEILKATLGTTGKF